MNPENKVKVSRLQQENNNLISSGLSFTFGMQGNKQKSDIAIFFSNSVI